MYNWLSFFKMFTNSRDEIILLLLRRTHNAGQNLNAGISVFLICETEIPVLIKVFQKQTFFSIKLGDN
jgi:hypothetical protein